MQTPIPTSALVALWLNSWNRGRISQSDARNALEATTQQSIELPQFMSHAVALDQTVALTRELVLCVDSDGMWNYVPRENTIAIPDPVFAKQRFLNELEISAQLLSELDLVGSREEIEKALDGLEQTHLPPISTRDFASLNSAVRTRIATQCARSHTLAMASPSQDNNRLQILNSLEKSCTDLVYAISSTA